MGIAPLPSAPRIPFLSRAFLASLSPTSWIGGAGGCVHFTKRSKEGREGEEGAASSARGVGRGRQGRGGARGRGRGERDGGGKVCNRRGRTGVEAAERLACAGIAAVDSLKLLNSGAECQGWCWRSWWRGSEGVRMVEKGALRDGSNGSYMDESVKLERREPVRGAPVCRRAGGGRTCL
eukprot:2142230-Rhodomonas_salina.1